MMVHFRVEWSDILIDPIYFTGWCSVPVVSLGVFYRSGHSVVFMGQLIDDEKLYKQANCPDLSSYWRVLSELKV